MSVKRRPSEDVWDDALQRLSDMVKAGLLESQSSSGGRLLPSVARLNADAVELCDVPSFGRRGTLVNGEWAVSPLKRMSGEPSSL